MAFVYGDRVKETSLSVGTGPFTLGGATAGFQSFLAGVGLGNETFYGILNTLDNTWEMGRGTVGASTITRDTVFSSSNSNNLVNFGIGDKIVYTTVPNTFYSAALDAPTHELIDHTVGPLNLLDATAHSTVDHTAAPLNLLSAAAHDLVDHTAAPLSLLDVPAHEGVDHTAAPLNLMDTTAHGLVDHTIGPLFLLNSTAHATVDHSTVLNNNPSQVTSPERTAGTETSLRSYSPLDIATMASIHGAGGAGKLIQQVRVQAQTTVVVSGPIQPWTDVAPQIGNGSVVLTTPFTPVFSTSFLTFAWSASIGGQAGLAHIAWLAEVGVNDGLAATFSIYNPALGGAHDFCLSIDHFAPAVDTSTRTYQIRVGNNGGGVARVGGGSDGLNKFNGTNNNSLIITEIAV